MSENRRSCREIEWRESLSSLLSDRSVCEGERNVGWHSIRGMHAFKAASMLGHDASEAALKTVTD